MVFSEDKCILLKEEKEMSNVVVRTGSAEDIAACLDIYNYEVLHGVATLDIQPRTLDEWNQWFNAHRTYNRPLLVATIDNQVAGYATLSGYRDKEAYISTVELSIYVSPNFRKHGVATALMGEILDYAKKEESIHLVVSVITAGNEASVKLHEKFGFTYSGQIPMVGVKNNEYLAIDNYYLIVREENE